MKKTSKARLFMMTAMFIYGTIGIFRRFIPLPSSILAMVRGVIGTVFLLGVVVFGGKKLSKEAIRKNALLLIVSGALIGFNWILLFESYAYTSVATATLCYYMAPVIVTLLSPLVLKESLKLRHVLCILVALVGMGLVSGIMQAGFSGASEMKGILFGLGAAAFYATVILMNKKIHDIGAYEKTIIQLASAAIVVFPYCLLTEDFSAIRFEPVMLLMLLVVGVVHTGIAYTLYFGSMTDLSAHTIAIFSYIDPVVAIVLSTVLLGEALDVSGMIGAVLILGSTLYSELADTKD